MISRITVIFLVLMSGITASTAQTLFLQGANVTVTGGGVLFVSGGVEITAGRIDALDLSRFTVEGNVNVNAGGLYLFKDARGLITGDLSITQLGTCWRYRPGVLTVEGSIYNDGQLNNDGEINIGKP